MDTEMKLYVTEIRDGIYLMDEGHQGTGYLVIGRDRACMIDTMNAETDLGEAVRKLTDKPVIVVNTHGHPDHIFGNIFFEEAYLDPADFPMAKMFTESPEYKKYAAEKGWGKMPPFREIREGDTLDLGGRTLEVYSLPGHTPGGILLLLKEDRILFTGDSINHHLWMQLDGCLPIHEFIKELDRVMFLEDRADIILHGHARAEDDISLMRCLRRGAEEICAGKTEQDLPYSWFGGTDLQHPFRCDPDRHYQQEDHVICYRANNV